MIGFAGRALADEDKPKYLNVTNTPLYDKGNVLYNLDRAKGHLREEGAVVVEGYMDVIGLAGAGVQNAVASCGTALTAEHVKLLARYAERFYLAFDGDEAGRSAAWAPGRAVPARRARRARVPLPTGVDPDELAREQGAAAWDAAAGRRAQRGAASGWSTSSARIPRRIPRRSGAGWPSSSPLYRQTPR